MKELLLIALGYTLASFQRWWYGTRNMEWRDSSYSWDRRWRSLKAKISYDWHNLVWDTKCRYKKKWKRSCSKFKPRFKTNRDDYWLVYKKVRVKTTNAESNGWNEYNDYGIAELRIPKKTKYFIGDYDSCSEGYKHRAERAFVTAITRISDGKLMPEARSTHTLSFVYKPGIEVVPDVFSLHKETCAAGIHFFLTRKQAELY